MPNANEQITTTPVRLIDDNGDMLGVVPVDKALEMARRKGLDLVEISPNAEPPVCKIQDFGKFKFEAQKRAHDARKKQKVVKVKEIKLRPTIDQHDYDVKLRSIQKFINSGDKVKISLRFRGREIVHQDVALELLNRIKVDVEEIAKVELEPRLEGRQMLMILVPR